MRRALAALAIACAMALPALAQPKPAPSSRPSPQASAAPPSSSLTNGQFTVDTDETNYNLNNGDFDMPHHVHFTRPGTDVTGDSAKGNTRNDMITITGHVVLHQTGTLNTLGAGAKQVTSEQPSTLTTDQLVVDGKAKTYTAIGNVKWTQGNKTLLADHGILNEVTHQLNLQGNVHIEQGEQSMNADHIDYNTDTEDGTAYGAPVLARMPVAPAPATSPMVTPRPRRGLRRYF
jgi:lipopolysaccharide assembly outer membrane protein LptD (OstA)